MAIDTTITTYNTALTDTGSEILGKERRRKVLNHCDERTDFKERRYEAEEAKAYREAKRNHKAVKKAKEFSVRSSKLA